MNQQELDLSKGAQLAYEQVDPVVQTMFWTVLGKAWSQTDKLWLGAPGVFYSPPGKGKTSDIRSIAKRMRSERYPNGIPHACIKPGARGDAQFGVVPFPIKIDDYRVGLDFPGPALYQELFEHGVGILNIGELNTGGKMVQAALNALVLDREWGAWFVGEDGDAPTNHVWVIGDANPTEMAAGASDLAMNSANRLCHFEWPGHSPDAWTDYVLSEGSSATQEIIDYDSTLKELLKAWPEAYANTAGLITAFVRRNTQWYREDITPDNPRASKAWASERSWERAVRCYATAIAQKRGTDIADKLVEASVGAAAANAFRAFRANKDLPDPIEFMEGRAPFVHDVKRLDRTYVLLLQCQSHLVSEATAKSRRQQWSNVVWDFMEELVHGEHPVPDIVRPTLTALFKAKLVGKSKNAAEVQRRTKLLAVMDSVVTATVPF